MPVVRTSAAEPASAAVDPDGRDEGLAGYRVGRVLDKMGMTAQEPRTFSSRSGVRRIACSVAEEGKGMHQLWATCLQRLTIERRRGPRWRARSGNLPLRQGTQGVRPAIGDFQNTRFKLAEVTTITRWRHVFDRCIEQLVEGSLDSETRGRCEVVGHRHAAAGEDSGAAARRLRLHDEYLVCRCSPTRVCSGLRGTNEIMKELISTGSV